jgi:hypothetical protein
MILGFALTGAALLLMLVAALVQIRRVDRTIERVDRELARRPPDRETGS